jgi:broad specificity phosphatase PhoE
MQGCKLYLVRHGESVANANKLVGGHLDSILTEKGRQQANSTRKLFSNIHFDDAYSSDLIRALETGQIIYGKMIKPDHQLFDLRERTFGKLEGEPEKTWIDIDKAYEDKYALLPFSQRLEYNYADFIESDKLLLARFSKSLIKISKSHTGQTVLIATHGGGIRVLLMKLGYSEYIGAGDFANAGYVELMCKQNDFIIKNVIGVVKDKS